MPTVTAPHVQSKSGQTGLTTTVLPVNGRRPGIANEFVCDRMVMLLRAVLMSTTEKGGEIRGRRDGESEGKKEKREREREREEVEERARVARRVCACGARTRACIRHIVRTCGTVYDSLQFIVWTSICQVSGRGRYRRFRRIFGVENCQLSQWNSIRIVH